MTNSIKLKMLSACVVLCLVVIAGLGYSTWVLYEKVDKLETDKSSNYSSVSPLISPPLKNDQHWNDVWGNLSTMQRDFSQMNQWMNDMMDSMTSGRSSLKQPGFSVFQQGPTIDFEETDSEYKVVIEKLEGEEVELNTGISDGVLSVSGKVKRSTSNNGNSLFSQSQFSSEFSRNFVLDEPVDQAAMEVINETGKTVVRVPKLVG